MTATQCTVNGLLMGALWLVLAGPVWAAPVPYPQIPITNATGPIVYYPSVFSPFSNYPTTYYPSGFDPIARAESLSRQIAYYERQIRDVGGQMDAALSNFNAARQRLETAQKDGDAAKAVAGEVRQQLDQLRRQQTKASADLADLLKRTGAAGDDDPRIQALAQEADAVRLALLAARTAALTGLNQTPAYQQAVAQRNQASVRLGQLKAAGAAGTPEMIATSTEVIAGESAVNKLVQAAADSDPRCLEAAARLRDLEQKLRTQRARNEATARQAPEYQALDQAVADGRLALAQAQAKLTDGLRRQAQAEAATAQASADVTRFQSAGQQLEKQKAMLDDRRAEREIELRSLQYVWRY